MRKELSFGNTIVMALGTFILSISRPFEGLVLCAGSGVLVFLAIYHWIRAGETGKLVAVFFLPFTVLCVMGAGWHLYYNYRLTDDPLTLPYSNYQHRQNAETTNKTLKKYKGSPTLETRDEIRRVWVFFFGPILSLSLLGLWRDWKRPETLLAIALSLLVVALSITGTRAWPHYMAPAVGLFVYLVMQGFWSLQTIAIKRFRIGYYLSILILTVFFVNSTYTLYRVVDKGPMFSRSNVRLKIIRYLLKEDGKDLVFVRYGRKHNVHSEWVYNGADIDNSEIVWARELSPQRNQHLRKYFTDRRVWLILADKNPVRVIAYREAEL
jgi:uncharacterized membrane protein YciS (DUF1049 family)